MDFSGEGPNGGRTGSPSGPRLATALATLLLLAASAAWPVGSINAALDKPQVTVGDPVTYTVTIIVPAGAQAKLPGEQAKFGKLEVRGYQPTETPQADGTRQAVLVYTLAAFDVGAHEIGDFKVPVADADGKTETYLAPPVTVTVKSVLPEKGEAQPKGFYGPVTLPAAWVQWATAAIIALLILGLVVLILWLRRRRRPKAAPVVEEILRADEAALRALRRLAEDRTAAAGDMLGFYLRLDEILRAWLEARFELPAMNRTTLGLAYLLRVRRDADPWRQEFVDLLRTGDAVKFAGVVPDDEQAYRDVAAAEEVVGMAAPPPPEVPPAEAKP